MRIFIMIFNKILDNNQNIINYLDCQNKNCKLFSQRIDKDIKLRDLKIK